VVIRVPWRLIGVLGALSPRGDGPQHIARPHQAQSTLPLLVQSGSERRSCFWHYAGAGTIFHLGRGDPPGASNVPQTTSAASNVHMCRPANRASPQFSKHHHPS